ncbi:MAG TPA: cupin domain-containing protein [Legionellales bacterium]|nr:cupin domain-containing protein [Legionellales bacterium]
MVVRHVFEKTNFNDNWKVPLATGEETQVVIMSVSPKTNPQNEVGTETHAFDQVIFIISGQAKVILDKKEHLVKKGDMIFVPLGTPHQIINLNQDKPLKLMSVYSQKDMPDVIFKKQADEQ